MSVAYFWVGEIRQDMFKLNCQVPETTQRKKRGKSTRVAQLEKKIDGIVSLLAANQRKGLSPLTPESPQETQTQVQVPPRPCEEIPMPPLVVDPTSIDLANRDDRTAFFSTDMELFPGFRVSHEQAAERLAVYRRDYIPHYPFVPMSGAISSHELYVESRILFWTILAVVSPLEDKVQMEFKAWFRKYLAEHLIVRQEKSIDILQAILVYLAWNDFHFYGELQVTNIVQLALALVVDLRLDKHAGAMIIGPKTLLGDAWSSMGKPCPKMKVHQSAADKRAVLGVYHITNLLSTYFKKSTLLNWSSHLAQCCDSLVEAPEYKSDLYLVSLVRMQHIADRAFSVIPAIDTIDPTPPTFKAVTAMAIDNVRRELERFSKAQPDPVQQSQPFQRSEYMWKCLEEVCVALGNHAALPPIDISVLPVTVSCVLAFVTVTASRLILTENAPDWDVTRARRRLQFQDLLKRVADLFELADEEAQRLNRRRRVMEDGSSVFLKSSFKVRWIRQWYLSKIPQEEQQEMQQSQTAVEPSMVLQNNPDWASNFQFDDEFWADLMSGYDAEALEKSLTTVSAVQ
ncbi:hypothetical protein ACHAPJ_002065 [Fusarium lateritium]